MSEPNVDIHLIKHILEYFTDKEVKGKPSETDRPSEVLYATPLPLSDLRRMLTEIHTIVHSLKETFMTRDDFQTEITKVTTTLDSAVNLLHTIHGLILQAGSTGDGATPDDLQAWHDTLETGLAKLQGEMAADTPPAPPVVEPAPAPEPAPVEPTPGEGTGTGTT
jgi:hypothetical protein